MIKVKRLLICILFSSLFLVSCNASSRTAEAALEISSATNDTTPLRSYLINNKKNDSIAEVLTLLAGTNKNLFRDFASDTTLISIVELNKFYLETDNMLILMQLLNGNRITPQTAIEKFEKQPSINFALATVNYLDKIDYIGKDDFVYDTLKIFQPADIVRNIDDLSIHVNSVRTFDTLFDITDNISVENIIRNSSNSELNSHIYNLYPGNLFVASEILKNGKLKKEICSDILSTHTNTLNSDTGFLDLFVNKCRISIQTCFSGSRFEDGCQYGLSFSYVQCWVPGGYPDAKLQRYINGNWNTVANTSPSSINDICESSADEIKFVYEHLSLDDGRYRVVTDFIYPYNTEYDSFDLIVNRLN